MHARNATLGLSLLVFAFTGNPFQNPGSGGTPARPADRIVGLWSTQGTVAGCETGTPVINPRNTLLFHAGGTLTENIAPTTARNQGLGVWSYDQTAGSYTLHLRYDRFSNGVNIGFATVDRQLFMSEDGQQISGPVRANFYATDGTLTQELCGEATSVRIY